MLEISRKYFSFALVLIDEKNQKQANINVPRALWGLIRVCKTIQNSLPKDKPDQKNQDVLEIAVNRISQVYSANTDIDISKMSLINS